eukprot:gb/GFBE01034515.1/.p1 GENE.gb/GFBE01034515.1/~~gb/GFBE01034515.1/.p1  ORF type:complete len:610 (+),score=160.32 gb/GFBE01034515.1/:1-1830(+)
MPLPEAIGQCLDDLKGHILELQAKLDTLAQQNDKLRGKDGGHNNPSESDDLLIGLGVPSQGTKGVKFQEPEKQVDLFGTTERSEDTCNGNGQGDGRLFEPRTVKNAIRKVRKSAVARKLFLDDDSGPSDSLAAHKFTKLKTDVYQLEQYEKARLKDCGEVLKVLCATDPERPCLERIVLGAVFQTLTMAAIIANACYLGFAADNNVRNAYRPISCKISGSTGDDCDKFPEITAPDIGFAVWFSIEIALRLAVHKLQFFTGEDMYWNWFDMFLVAEAIIGLAFDTGRLSILRILRVFRMIRIVRLVRTVKALRRLRTMIFSILNSFIDLLWALLVVCLIIFVFGIIFANGVATYFDNAAATDDAAALLSAQDVHKEFGDLWRTMLSLWSAVSGGNDWMTYGELILMIDQGVLYFVIFNFYVAFCVVGLFNVVTGVFVDSAVCSRTSDEVVQSYIDELKSTTSQIRSYFEEADIDQSGTLTPEEFSTYLQDPLVKAYFSGLDIDPHDANIIFSILDADKSNEITINEFVNGTMKLKGTATKLDVVAMMFDQTKQSMRFDNLCEYIQTELSDIKESLETIGGGPGLRSQGLQVRDCPSPPRVDDDDDVTEIL